MANRKKKKKIAQCLSYNIKQILSHAFLFLFFPSLSLGSSFNTPISIQMHMHYIIIKTHAYWVK